MPSENVWSFWEGPIWPHIQVCIDSMRRTCPGFVLLTPENIREFVDIDSVLHKKIKDIQEPARKADCYRAAVLYTHGGFYFDCDTIGLKDPSVILEKNQEECLYCIWSNPPRRILNGNIYLKKGSVIGREWLKNINNALARHAAGTCLKWTSLGELALSPAVDLHPEISKKIARDHFLPIDVDNNVKEFFRASNHWTEWVSDRTVCFGLNNSWMMHNKKQEMLMSPEKQESSKLLVHQLLSDTRKLNLG